MTDPRPRLVERLREAGAYRVTIIAAPAGFGKSTVLSQFLEGAQRCSRVDIVPGMTTAQLAAGLTAALEAATETIAVDGVDALSDPASGVATLVDCIERSVHVSWIVATRTVSGLPLGTWLAHRDCELVVESADLLYTRDEIADAALRLGFGLADDELDDIVALTEGWPPAVGVALRAAARAQNRARLHSTVRDAAYWYFQEAVYPGLASAERELLTVAVALPEIDVGLLELAGFPRAHEAIDALRDRTMLLERGPNGTYRCLSLFRGFLRRQIEVAGSQEIARVYSAAARGLEAADRVGDALDAFICAKSHADVLRLLEQSGFDLLERGQSSVIGRAVDVLNEPDKRLNPHVLALRGVLQSLSGNSARAEAFLRRSLTRAKENRDVVGFARLRLALMMANYGSDVVEILNPVADDPLQPTPVRAEALSLRATAYAMGGDLAKAREDLANVWALLPEVDLDATRAKILQRVGVAAMHARDVDHARQYLTQAAELATELELHGIASRSWAALSNLMCHEYDDVMSQLWFAELAAAAAEKSGDALGFQTALLQVAAAEMRRGNAEESVAIEDQLTGIKADPNRAFLLEAFRALRLAWDGRFEQAHRALLTSWDKMFYDFDRLVCGAQCALFLAVDHRREASIRTIGQVNTLLERIEPRCLIADRYVALALLIAALAESTNGRRVNAEKLVRKISLRGTDPVVRLARQLGEAFMLANLPRCRGEIAAGLDHLAALGHVDVSRLLGAVAVALDADSIGTRSSLTRAELEVLSLLSEGLSNKEIALRNKRSVYTIRAHVASVLKKLRCHGRTQAVVAARRLEIIP